MVMWNLIHISQIKTKKKKQQQSLSLPKHKWYCIVCRVRSFLNKLGLFSKTNRISFFDLSSFK